MRGVVGLLADSKSDSRVYTNVWKGRFFEGNENKDE